MINNSGQQLYGKAKALIPGGTQLLSKRPEMFAPGIWPSYYKKAKGAKVWDLDGKEYIDMSIMAVGACILGYADNFVDEAVIDAVKSGVNSTLNCPEEVALAEKLISMHPWFDMVRYARGGGEAMSIAIRIARAKTKRDAVYFSGYHGWNDWYLAANLTDAQELDGQLMPGLEPSGVPRGLTGSAYAFDANSIHNLKAKIKGNELNVAAIVIEPARGENAPKGYLEDLKCLAKEIGAVLIFDEITSGFRACAGGIHRKYGVYPDVAVLAKSLANGYAMATIMGTSDVMQAAQDTFISSTNWTERIGPAAAIATIEKYEKTNTADHIVSIGRKVKEIWRSEADKNGIKLRVSGIDSLASFAFISNKSIEMETIFCINMMKKGFLAYKQFKPSLSHTEEDINAYAAAVAETFRDMAKDPECINLESEAHQVGFKRITKE